jgi:hypothetical protein
VISPFKPVWTSFTLGSTGTFSKIQFLTLGSTE